MHAGVNEIDQRIYMDGNLVFLGNQMLRVTAKNWVKQHIMQQGNEAIRPYIQKLKITVNREFSTDR